MKTYSELIAIPTFIERYRYLKIGGAVGAETFGRDRYLNQVFYRSFEWRRFRDQVILRDYGCELAFPNMQIRSALYVHHINPITVSDVIDGSPALFDPENVVCCSFKVHQAIHYGDESLIPADWFVERTPYDTCPWR